MNDYNLHDFNVPLAILLQILMYIQIILFFCCFFFSSISVSSALCVAFGAKIKSVIEPEKRGKESFIWIQKAEPRFDAEVSL